MPDGMRPRSSFKASFAHGAADLWSVADAGAGLVRGQFGLDAPAARSKSRRQARPPPRKPRARPGVCHDFNLKKPVKPADHVCRAPHYQVCSFETDRRDLPLVDFNELKLDCQMVVLSEQSARLIIVSTANPFAGPAETLRFKLGKNIGTLKVTGIDYVIYCERANGDFASQGYHHPFTKPVEFKGSVMTSAPRKLFKLVDLSVLLDLKEFNCTRAIQFTA